MTLDTRGVQIPNGSKNPDDEQVPLNHSNAGAHLYRQRVYVHAIVEQCKCSVGVPKAIKCSVLTSAGACEQTSINH